MVSGQPRPVLSSDAHPTGAPDAPSGAEPHTEPDAAPDAEPVAAGTRHAGVVGSPIAHSRSPDLHRAAWRALGLSGWTYHREEVRAGELADYVANRPADWVGLSVTMPGKEEAVALADERDELAQLVGAANTLIRTARGWRAANTDVPGLVAALRDEGVGVGADPWREGRADGQAIVLGSGATARAVLVALHRLGCRRVTLVVRDEVRPATRGLAERLGLQVRVLRDGSTGWGAPDVVISTVPPGSAPALDGTGDLSGAVVLDVVYAGWPTPWAERLLSAGIRVVGGEGLLVHQAVEQVWLMTGRRPPVQALRAALRAGSPDQGP